MENTSRKVTPGDPFRPPPAEIWNNMVDAGQAFASSQLSQGPPRATRSRPTDLLKLKNSSGDVRRKGEILKIDGKVIETVTAEHIWLDGVEPGDDCRFGILKEPAEEDEVVAAQVSGVCMATVNVTDAAHTFASAVEGEYLLQSGSGGQIEILFAPDGTGELECVVRFASAGSRIVGIEIISVDDSDPDDITALCSVTAPCGRVADEDDYGQITVHDLLMGCLLTESPADLVERKGWATLTTMRADPYCEATYQLMDLCCADT